MICAKNYETVFKFVIKVMPKILVAFFRTWCSCTTDAVFSEVHYQWAIRERRA